MKLQGTAVEQPAGGRAGFASALAAGDLEAAVACFARDGSLITADRTLVQGRDRIRPLLAQMLIRGFQVEVELSSAVGGDEVLLVSERWQVRLGPGDRLGAQTLHPTLVLRFVESTWKLAIAAPWGWQGWRQ